VKQHPISVAFGHVDATPSDAFRAELRERFLDSLHPGNDSDHVTVLLDDDTVTVVESRPPSGRRWKVVMGVAASIAVVAGLTVVIVTHRSESTAVDTTHDATIAKLALLDPDQFGSDWSVSQEFSNLTSRQDAIIAASVARCAPYVDYAFDSPTRRAVTAGRNLHHGDSSTLVQWVYIFPSDAAASKAMDKIAEPGFVGCFNEFMGKLLGGLFGAPTISTTVAAPPLTSHGDRQIVLGQSIRVTQGPGTFSLMNAFIQVGRGIVYVDPTLIEGSTDTANIEKAYNEATISLTKALDSGGK